MRGARGAGATGIALAAVAGFLVAFFGGLSRAGAAAEAEAEVVSVSFVTTEQCPTREAFLSSVRRYTTRWRVAADEEIAPVRHFLITFDRRGSSPRGTLLVEKTVGQGTKREIVATDCERVARGLAIAMALALDPTAEISSSSPRSPASVPPATTDDASPEPSEPPAPEPPVVPAPVASVRRDALPPLAPKPAPSRIQLGVEAKVELATTITGAAVPVLGAGVVLRTRLPRVPPWLAPSFAVGVRQSLSADVDSSAVAAGFSWTVAAVRACPVRLDLLASRLVIVPCAEADVGVLRVEARGTVEARSSTTDWFDLGGSVRALYHVRDALGIGVAGLVTAPFVRHRFALDDGTVLSQPPAVGVAGGLVAELLL